MGGFEHLFKRSFVESPLTSEQIYVALRRDDHLFCLECLLSEKVEVEFKSEQDVLNHIEVAHPRLYDFILSRS